MASFEGKVNEIAITGAASGIGLAIAQILASRGALLALADINEAALNTAKDSLPSTPDTANKHAATTVRVEDSAAVSNWIEQTKSHYGRLDGAVNMAGVYRDKGTGWTNVTDDDWETTISVNARGVFNCLRVQLKHMGEGGSIVSAASVAGRIGTGSGPYCASKWAVVGMTQSAAREAGEKGLRVNCVAPGFIETPMTDVFSVKAKETGLAKQCLHRMAQVSGDVLEDSLRSARRQALCDFPALLAYEREKETPADPSTAG
ncbi:uncharacterized protein LTR77_008787 [Saxophila tyrrhenica]|uniref:Uncharacterized protein n=1 Tax=Saxophila tyrrhenica TaxID=1690608 RepID=A0AAV9P0W0_9PEZI|nr:hypothetical protein LTR77_008787 [Saxophila tyrrhenica]